MARDNQFITESYVIPMHNPKGAYVPGDVNDPRNGMTVGAIVGAGLLVELNAEQESEYNNSMRGRVQRLILHHAPVAPRVEDMFGKHLDVRQ